MNRTRRTRLVVVRRPQKATAAPKAEAVETVNAIEGIDFAKEFPFVLNQNCGEIELVGRPDRAPISRTVSRKPVNGKPEINFESVIPDFSNFEYSLFGGCIGITLFCTALRLFGIM